MTTYGAFIAVFNAVLGALVTVIAWHKGDSFGVGLGIAAVLSAVLLVAARLNE